MLIIKAEVKKRLSCWVCLYPTGSMLTCAMCFSGVAGNKGCEGVAGGDQRRFQQRR